MKRTQALRLVEEKLEALYDILDDMDVLLESLEDGEVDLAIESFTNNVTSVMTEEMETIRDILDC
jgi:hypothetical protein|tara:strand:+ start:946 stop:1140 length:195 start_codon:yes stop_codon:yes gene_type:complete